MRKLSLFIVLAGLVFFSLPLVSLSQNKTDNVNVENKTDFDVNTIEALVNQLGDANFDKRQEADKQLRNMGKDVVPLLKKYINNPDPEISWRIQNIIKDLSPKINKENKQNENNDSDNSSKQNNESQSFINIMNGNTSASISISTNGHVKVVLVKVNDGVREEKTYEADSIEEFQKKYPEIAKQFGVGLNNNSIIISPNSNGLLEDMKKQMKELDEQVKQMEEEMHKRMKNLFGESPFNNKLTPPFDNSPQNVPSKPLQPKSNKKTNENIDQLMNSIGLTMETFLNEDNKPNGLLVTAVEKDSISNKIGIIDGDILLSINDLSVNSVWEFRRIVLELIKNNKIIRIKFKRNNQENIAKFNPENYMK